MSQGFPCDLRFGVSGRTRSRVTVALDSGKAPQPARKHTMAAQRARSGNGAAAKMALACQSHVRLGPDPPNDDLLFRLAFALARNKDLQRLAPQAILEP